MDGIFLFLASSAIITLIFPNQILGDILPSKYVKLWLIGFGIFFLFWYGVIVYKVKSYKPQHPSQRKKSLSTDEFFPDEPITDENDDLLDRKLFVADLYNQITKYPFSDSFVFGLYGSWGEGKTSALNLLKKRLNENDIVIVFEFDPWYFSSQGALIKGFYDGLYAALNKKLFLPNIKRAFTKYQKALSSGLKLYGVNIDLGLSDDSLEELKEKIQNGILSTGKKIVIIIDDIDRLRGKNEILEVFKLVKLSGNFRNTIFVLSYDPNIICSYLKNEMQSDPSFIDKIIQSPIHLPAINQAMIDKFLFYSYLDDDHYSSIDRLFKKLNIDEERIQKEFGQDFTYLYEKQIKKLFQTLRCAKRYLNGLHLTLSAIKNEINLQDFLILELIRIFYHEIYKDIWEHPWYYIPSDWSENVDISSPFSFTNKEIKYEKIKEHISKIVSKQDKSEILLELLKVIFPVEIKIAFGEIYPDHSSAYRAEKRITHPDVFTKYFMLRVPPEELPDEMVESLISRWLDIENVSWDLLGRDANELESEIIKNLRDFQRKNKLLKLLNKLIVFHHRIRFSIAKSLSRSIYKNINIFSRKGRENFWNSEFDRAKSLMLHLINEKIERIEIEPFIIEIIKETSSFEFAVGVVLSCHRERGRSLFNIYDNIDIYKLQKTLSERLSHYFIKGKKNIFEEEKDAYGFILYQWGTASEEDGQKVNDYVFSLIEMNPKYLGKIISGYIWKEPGVAEKNIRYNDLIRLYDENTLYKKIKEHYSNAYSNQEEKSAIDLFIKEYDKRQASALEQTNQEANKHKFLEALNKGRDYFREGKFNEALKEFNRALTIKDLKDEHGWMGEVKYERWKTLLELAWNNGKPKKEYFEEACGLAGNEAQIKVLVDGFTKNGVTPGKAPLEFYYCLFYYLQWHFAEVPEKNSIKINFTMHYEIATGDHTSSRSDKINDRCNELLSRMS